MTIDRIDISTPPYFLAQLKYFTSQAINTEEAREPLFHRLDYIIPRKTLDQTIAERAGLLELNDADDANSDSDEEDAFKVMKHLTTYWYPECRDISILPTTVAESISALTKCSIYPEKGENRIRLVNGDFQTALRKLQNMEPQLVCEVNIPDISILIVNR